jgi:hypothetical protein
MARAVRPGAETDPSVDEAPMPDDERRAGLHMPFICGRAGANLAFERGRHLITRLRFSREGDMQDILWIAVMLGLTAATLAYARLCDKA